MNQYNGFTPRAAAALEGAQRAAQPPADRREAPGGGAPHPAGYALSSECYHKIITKSLARN